MTTQGAGSIEGRTVIVTGAASGIGRALALGFLGDGARVIAADVNAARLESLGDRGVGIQVTDVREPDQVEALVARAERDTGRVDVLVNNAGNAILQDVEALAPGAFENVIAVHLFGTVYGMRAAIPRMRRQGFGRIVNLLSRAAEYSWRGNAAYASAKAAIWALTRTAAQETQDTDILVNGLLPGPTNTPIWGRARPDLQGPEAVYPTALLLATLPEGGASGSVYWDGREYPLMANAGSEKEPGAI